MALDLTEYDLHHPEVLGVKLINMAEIVIRRHFFYTPLSIKEDLVSVAVLKALEEINGGSFDSSKGAFYSYVYTGMRNAIHNYLYHETKHSGMEDLSDYKGLSYEDEYQITPICSVSLSTIAYVASKFSFGAVEFRMAARLREMGFQIAGISDKELNQKSCDAIPLDSLFSDAVVRDTINRLCGLVVWQLKQQDED